MLIEQVPNLNSSYQPINYNAWEIAALQLWLRRCDLLFAVILNWYIDHDLDRYLLQLYGCSISYDDFYFDLTISSDLMI